MSNILVRGLSPQLHRQIQKLAESENLSVNQMLVHLIKVALEQKERGTEKERREAEAFRRLREIREENFRQFGLSDDSTKIIRELRDSRNQ